MKRLVTVLALTILLAPCCWRAVGAVAEEPHSKETVLDRVEHLEDALVLDIPPAPRLCDAVKGRKGPVAIGDCKLYCEDEGSGTAIVLLHGGPGATHHYFHPYFSSAAEWARIVYYDQRGCGSSDYQPGTGYSVDQAVDDLDALRKALGIERWVVLGHSYGGTLAQCYAVKYPERILALVLVGSAGYGLPVRLPGSREYDFMTEAEQKRIQEIRADGSLSMEQSLFNSHLSGDWKRQSFYRPSRDQLAQLALYEWKHDPGFRGPVSQSLDAVDLAGAFEACPVPVLIMEGKWDLTWGATKPSVIQDCFPGSTLVVFDQAGHSPFADMPPLFLAMLKAFVAELSEPSGEALERWKRRLANLEGAKEKSPERLLRSLGWGKTSSEKLAERYAKDWLEQVDDPVLLLRLGFALYDAENYEDARQVFKKMADNSRSAGTYSAVATLWQGHMLDLLGKRQQAVAAYQKVVEMGETGMMRHDQYGLAYSPSAYAAEKIEKPFTRVENLDEN